MGRKLGLAGLLLIVGWLVFRINPTLFSEARDLFYYSPCRRPIGYRVETVDPQFKVSREKFLGDISEAAGIWEKAEGKPLFVFDPDGELSINLIFDERQQLTNQISSQESTLTQQKGTISERIADYQKQLSDFNQQVANLNSQIAYWNSHGGAPPEEYNKLTTEQQQLKKQADYLNGLARELNQSTNSYNAGVGQLNQTIDQYNQEISYKPEEGIYRNPPPRIEIYFVVSHDELVHTLAHELGHARGLVHIDDPKAIMFSKTTTNLNPSNDDTVAIKEVCRGRSLFELFQKRIEVMTGNTFSK